MTDDVLSAPAPRRGLPHVPEDSLLASILLSFLATAGLFYVNIMAALVDGLISGAGLTSKQAGLVVSANVYGAAVGALVAVFIIRRLPWRPTALSVLCGLIVVDLLSTLIKAPDLLIGLRFFHGLMGGLLVGVAFAVIARTKTPDRTFGMLLVVQFGLGGLGLMFLPRLVPVFGHGVLFLALAAFSAVTLAMTPFLGVYAPRPAPSPLAAKAATRWVPLILAFAAIFLFQASNMGLAAYIIGLGKAAGLELGLITGTLGAANWIGALGSMLVVAIGVRFGRFWPLMAGLALTLGGTWAFHFSGLPWIFLIANIGTAVTWAFVIPYLLGMCAAFDTVGQMAALGGFFSKMGLASGPALAAFVVAGGRYDGLINLAVAGLLLSGLASIAPALALDRQRPPA
ncbi:MFS transporter [Brevundimonas sp.]|uniref:MFS transporter n=1 Tax=Brevundimonas sp. TaxID=1871086 RepID=UPI0025BF3B3E|nr:MFS transporter [Brevundimonas sp.]